MGTRKFQVVDRFEGNVFQTALQGTPWNALSLLQILLKNFFFREKRRASGRLKIKSKREDRTQSKLISLKDQKVCYEFQEYLFELSVGENGTISS